LFGIIGSTLLFISSAKNSLGEIPNKANELVLSFEKRHSHTLVENNFSPVSFPDTLLYGDGRLLCSTETAGNTDNDVVPVVREQRLDRKAVESLVGQIRDSGFETVASKDRSNNKYIEPIQAGNHIRLNTSNGSVTASLYPTEASAEFTAIANLIDQACAQTTTAFEPEDVVVEAKKLADVDPSTVAAVLPETLIPAEADNTKLKQRSIKGQEAREARQLIKAEQKNYRVGAQVFKVRVIPTIPAYEEPIPVKADKSGKVSAATVRPTRWLWVIPAEGGPSGDIGGIANDVRNFNQAKVGKTFDIVEVAVVRGAKTANQYRQCPAGRDCSGGPAFAIYYNLEAEFARGGFSTNVMYGFSSGMGCIGIGGPITNVDSTQFSYGFGSTTATDCNWYDASRTIPAHEAGHTFGLVHTCDGSLMVSGCGTRPQSWGQQYMNGNQAGLLRDRSPYFQQQPVVTGPCPNSSLYGFICDKWRSIGGSSSVLGNNTTSEANTPCRNGRYNDFQGGTITYRPDLGAKVIYGHIVNKWRNSGASCGIGLAFSDESGNPCGGRYNIFENGAAITWHPNTGAYITKGSIRVKHSQYGFECGFIGYPITDELRTPTKPGAYNHFQGGKSIYWSPNTPASLVHGAIRGTWASQGWENSRFGFPASDEFDFSDSTGNYRRNNFQGGAILWNKANGAISYR